MGGVGVRRSGQAECRMTALKELRETLTWLLVIQRKPLITPQEALSSITAECDELIAIFVTSIATAEKNR